MAKKTMKMIVTNLKQTMKNSIIRFIREMTHNIQRNMIDTLYMQKKIE